MENIQQVLSFSIFSVNEQTVTVGQLLLVIFVILFGYYLIHKSNKLIVARLNTKDIDKDLVLLVQRLYLIVMLVILALIALSFLNVPLTAFAFVSGALAIGIGFGAQNIINNFISGWILMWERPIRIGDFLEIGETKGTVETINTRSTLVRRVDGVHLLIPNSQLLESIVVNWTLVDRLLRGSVMVGVAYGSPVKKVAELIEKATRDHKEVLSEPEPKVMFQDFGDNALIFEVFFWIQAVGERSLRVISSDIRFTIDDLFAAENIVIAFPQRDVHIDGELKFTKSDGNDLNS